MVEIIESVERRVGNIVDVFNQRAEPKGVKTTFSQWYGKYSSDIFLSISMYEKVKLVGDFYFPGKDVMSGSNDKTVFLNNNGEALFDLKDYKYLEISKDLLKMLEKEFPRVKFKLIFGKRMRNAPERRVIVHGKGR